MKKRLLSMLLCLTMVLQMLPATALAADSSGDFGNGVRWDVTGGTLTISVDPDYVATGDEEYGPGQMPDLNYSWSYGSGIQTDIPWYSIRDSITEIVIGEGVTRIGDHAFYLLTNARSVTFPEAGLQTIGQNAFCWCSSLTELHIPASVHTIEDSAFKLCSSLTDIDLPDGLTEIAAELFQDCGSLETVALPESVTSIGGAAFMYCSGLKSLYISANVTQIENPFPYCTGMENLVIDEANPNYSSAGGCLIDKASKTIVQGFSSSDLAAIPDGLVEHIAMNAFNSMYGLTDVVIPDGVKDIGDYAFSFCVTTEGSKDGSATAGLRSVTIPSSVTDIGAGAFESNYLLESLTLNEGLKNIGPSAFFDCGNLGSITIPSTTETIGCAAFWANTDVEEGGIEDGKGGTAAMEDIYILTRDVEIFQDPSTLPATTTIHGYTGSTAHVYAEMFNRTFIPFAEACDHDWVEGEITEQPTCETAGAQTYTCSKCDESYVMVLPALGHSWAVGYDDDTHWTYCTRCGIRGDSGAHIWDEGTVTAEPTCTEGGVRTYTCIYRTNGGTIGCGAVKTEPIAALDHDWDEGTVTTPPTCTEEGVKAVTCRRCGETATLAVDALGHDYDQMEWDHDGENHWHPCHRCGGQAEASAHQWGDGEVTTPPTYTDQGVMTWTCAVCSATRTEPIPVLSAEGRLLMIIEDPNGTALPSEAYSALEWLDAEGNTLLTGADHIILTDVAPEYTVSEETPVICRMTFNDETMLAFTVPRTAEFTFTEAGTFRSIRLTPRKELTVTGRLLPQQTALEGFGAALTVALPSGDRTTELTPDENGYFSVRIPQFSAAVRVEAEGYQPLTVKDVQARAADENNVIDLGTLALDRLAVNDQVLTAAYDRWTYSNVWDVATFGYFELEGPDGQTYTDIGASYARDDRGLPRILLQLGTDIRENLAAGDQVTLRYVNTDRLQNPYDMEPYTFTLRSTAESYEGDGIQPVFRHNGMVTIKNSSANFLPCHFFLFDSAGNLIHTSQGKSTWYFPTAGDYTVVAFQKNPYVSSISTLDELEEQGFAAMHYVKQSFHKETGETLDLRLNVPDFLSVSEVGLAAEVGEAQRKGDLVPVYLSFRFSPELEALYPDGLPQGLALTVRSYAAQILPLTKVNGKYAAWSDCSAEERVTASVGYEQLDLTLYGTSGTVCLYARPEGQTLSAYVGQSEFTGRINVTLPTAGITMTEPEGVASSPEGTLHLYTPLKSSGYSAKVYVNGEVACTLTRLNTYGTGENLLPYRLKRYGDGASVHTLYAEVLDGSGETVWTSEPYKVVLLNGDTPRATRLSIRMTNFNTNVEGTSATTTKDLDLLRGNWGTFPFQFYSAVNVGLDNTLTSDVVFDYQLTMEHPELVKGDTVRLQVFCGKNQYQPTITTVNLNRNEVTGTYDGTFVLEGGTYTAQDLPYGYSLDYSADWSREDWSTGQLEDRLAEHLRQQAEQEDVFVPQRVDMETLEFRLQTMDGLPEDEAQREEFRQDIRELAIAQNKMADAYDHLIADTAGALTEIIGEDTAADLLTAETAEDIASALGGLFGTMGAETVPEGVTEQDLLDAGYRAVTAEGVTVYAMADAAGNAVSVVDLASGIRVSVGSAPMARARSARSGGEQSGEADLMEALTKINSIRSAIATLVEAMVAYADEIITYFDKRGFLGQKYEWVDDFLIAVGPELTLTDEEAMAFNRMLPQLRLKLAKLLNSCQKVYTGVVSSVGARLPVGLVKGLGSAVKIIPGLGTLAGILIDYNSLLDTYEYAATKMQSLKGEMELARQQARKVLAAQSNPCLADPDAAWEAYVQCYRKVSELCSEAQDAIDDFAAHALSKTVALSGNIIPFIMSLIPGGQLVAMVSDVALYTTSNLLDFTLVAAEWNQSNVDELWDDVTSKCVDVLGEDAFRLKEDCDDGDDDDDDDDNNDDDNDDNDDDESEEGTIWSGQGFCPQYPLTPSYHIDPSGYIYEAVASNRIEGAETKAYYRGEDGQSIFWADADEVGEVNPQITGADGRYAWMTPIGDWLVTASKDGYYDADSKNDPAAVDGWLPVPPPQLNVHIGMVSKAAPAVVSAQAAADRLRVVFSQYMDIARLSGGLVAVTQDGAAVPVTVSFDDAEVSPTQSGVYYGTVMTLTRADGGAFAGDNIVVTVDGAAENYAGTAIGTTYTSAPLTAGQLVGSLEHSYPNRFVTTVGGSESVAVLVKDTAGNPMAGVTVTAEQTVGGTLQVDTAAISDETGRAVFTLRGVASGYDTIRFAADTASAALETRVSPIGTQAPKKPTANLSDYDSVESGTQLILSCATEGATIYYTTDNTCPCTDGEGRSIYTGPITLTESGFYRIAAYTAEGGYSERLNLHLTVTAAPPQTYAVVLAGSANGTLTPSVERAAAGETVTLAVTPDSGWRLKVLTVTDGSGAAVAVTESGGRYTFTMPASDVTAAAEFEQIPASTGGSDTYAIRVEQSEGGTVTVSPKSASEGSTVTVTAAPQEGYELKTLTVTDSSGRAVAVTESGGRYTFTMPDGRVTVRPAFARAGQGAGTFEDVTAADYFFDAVAWAVEQGITNGTSAHAFSPDAGCTRAQVVTFLWRAAGCPAPESRANPFADVTAEDYFCDAVLWAVEQGITNGTSADAFSPESICTRAQIVTFLHRSAGCPASSGSAAFRDVAPESYYAGAVSWAGENGITGGVGGGLFAPADDCTRAQVVTFLYRVAQA